MASPRGLGRQVAWCGHSLLLWPDAFVEVAIPIRIGAPAKERQECQTQGISHVSVHTES
jgi:hypothetical protein